jgi:very-short-patch-repair endonuclease
MDSANLIEGARELRKNSTPAEQMLWSYIRNNQLKGIKFYRQRPVCGYIIDFYCRPAKLGVELDGAGHRDAEQKELDQLRTAELEELGILILRFWNQQVMTDIKNVLDQIEKTARERIRNCAYKYPHPAPLPRS